MCYIGGWGGEAARGDGAAVRSLLCCLITSNALVISTYYTPSTYAILSVYVLQSGPATAASSSDGGAPRAVTPKKKKGRAPTKPRTSKSSKMGNATSTADVAALCAVDPKHLPPHNILEDGDVPDLTVESLAHTLAQQRHQARQSRQNAQGAEFADHSDDDEDDEEGAETNSRANESLLEVLDQADLAALLPDVSVNTSTSSAEHELLAQLSSAATAAATAATTAATTASQPPQPDTVTADMLDPQIMRETLVAMASTLASGVLVDNNSVSQEAASHINVMATVPPSTKSAHSQSLAAMDSRRQQYEDQTSRLTCSSSSSSTSHTKQSVPTKCHKSKSPGKRQQQQQQHHTKDTPSVHQRTQSRSPGRPRSKSKSKSSSHHGHPTSSSSSVLKDTLKHKPCKQPQQQSAHSACDTSSSSTTTSSCAQSTLFIGSPESRSDKCPHPKRKRGRPPKVRDKLLPGPSPVKTIDQYFEHVSPNASSSRDMANSASARMAAADNVNPIAHEPRLEVGPEALLRMDTQSNTSPDSGIVDINEGLIDQDPPPVHTTTTIITTTVEASYWLSITSHSRGHLVRTGRVHLCWRT